MNRRILEAHRRCFHKPSRPIYSGIDKVAENKINEWLRNRGDDDVTHGVGAKRQLPADRHGDLTRTLGVHLDYIHSKILADNKIKPESVERRIALDEDWTKLKEEIQRVYKNNAFRSIEEFLASQVVSDRFGEKIKKLDHMAKRCNDAIISDSMRFNGRSPVRHARRFRFDERIREAIGEVETTSRKTS